MSERIKIIVEAPGSHISVLSVQDAMRQVLDIFELMDADGGSDDQIVWNIVAANKSNPLTLEAEAVSLVAAVNVDVIARTKKAAFAKNMKDASEGRMPEGWKNAKALNRANRFLTRNKNGVGRTTVVLDPEKPPVIVTPSVADIALKVLKGEPLIALFSEDRTRDEWGSVEGRLLEVGTEYEQPAIRIEERISHLTVWCRVSEGVRDKIASEANFKDVWEHQRVLIRGKISYDKEGTIKRIYAEDVSRIIPRQMTLHDIHDPDFTEGMKTSEYLEKLRDGDLG